MIYLWSEFLCFFIWTKDYYLIFGENVSWRPSRRSKGIPTPSVSGSVKSHAMQVYGDAPLTLGNGEGGTIDLHYMTRETAAAADARCVYPLTCNISVALKKWNLTHRLMSLYGTRFLNFQWPFQWKVSLKFTTMEKYYIQARAAYQYNLQMTCSHVNLQHISSLYHTDSFRKSIWRDNDQNCVNKEGLHSSFYYFYLHVGSFG